MKKEEKEEEIEEKDTPETTDKPVTEDTDNDDVSDVDRGVKSDEDVRSQQAKDAEEEFSFETVDEDGEQDMRGTLKKLREKIKKLEAEKKEYLDLSQRARADYMNLKKETDAHRTSARIFANKKLIEELLPVLDAYDMAQANKEAWEKVDKNWRIGIEYIFNQLRGVLEKEGVTQFGNIGERFDPELHESMEHVPVTDKKDNDIIVQILQKGYRMRDTVLRHARVKTGEYGK